MNNNITRKHKLYMTLALLFILLVTYHIVFRESYFIDDYNIIRQSIREKKLSIISEYLYDYANSHNGYYPDKTIFSDYLNSINIDTNKYNCKYEYYAYAVNSHMNDRDIILVADIIPNGKYIVLFMTGRVEFVNKSTYSELLLIHNNKISKR